MIYDSGPFDGGMGKSKWFTYALPNIAWSPAELLVKLSKALINPNIEKRGEHAAVQNYKHVHSPLRNSFKSHGGTVTEIEFQLLPIK